MYRESQCFPTTVEFIRRIISPRSHIPCILTIGFPGILVHTPTYDTGTPIMIHIYISLQSYLAGICLSCQLSITLTDQIFQLFPRIETEKSQKRIVILSYRESCRSLGNAENIRPRSYWNFRSVFRTYGMIHTI